MIDRGDSSYPDAVQDADGTIYLVHDRGRFSFGEIVISRFCEDDIIAGTIVDRNSFLNQIISKIPARPYDTAELERQRAEDKAELDPFFKK